MLWEWRSESFCLEIKDLSMRGQVFERGLEGLFGLCQTDGIEEYHNKPGGHTYMCLDHKGNSGE